MLRIESQGSLDGLCGVYAIVNALSVTCDVRGKSGELLEVACRAIPKKRWPDVLFAHGEDGGTNIDDMVKMARRCLEHLGDARVKITFPFLKSPPKSNKEFWERFKEEFQDPKVRSAIVGVTNPFAHWIVAEQDGNRIWFVDSTPEKPLLRKNKKSLFAGIRKQRPGQWLLDRSELIVFRVG